MEYRDYYQTLGVPRTATQAEIKKAFRKLARENHPDRNPNDKAAEQRFKDVNEANEVLSDVEKRKRYDQLGANWEAFSHGPGRGGGDPFGPGGPFAGFRQGAGGANVRYEFRSGGEAGGFSDFFRMVFGGGGGSQGGDAPGRGGSFEDILSGMRIDGARAGGRHGAPKPLEATTELSLEEAFHGTTRIVEVAGRRLEVKIPRGVDTGSRVQLSGKGPEGRDIVVVTQVRPHGVFTRRGADLEREIPVTLAEALLGGEIPVGTLKGRVLLTIPAGTQGGKTFRLSGQGMPRLKGDGPGDLHVRIRVVLPTHLSDDARAAARRLAELADQPDPRG